jgi:hypothetical protein
LLRVTQYSSASKPCQLSTAMLCRTTLDPQFSQSSKVLLYIFC